MWLDSAEHGGNVIVTLLFFEFELKNSASKSLPLGSLNGC